MGGSPRPPFLSAKPRMANPTPIPLTPIPIDLDSPEFMIISNWPFEDSFVGRLLREDVPQRVHFGRCKIWVYNDPTTQLVGFGTFDVCSDYEKYAGLRPHPYIPLLAVNPTIKSLGYGTSILRHLIGEAFLFVLQHSSASYSDVLFLDVYTTSAKAIKLYRANGFLEIADSPAQDPLEENRSYLVMAKRVSISRREPPPWP